MSTKFALFKKTPPTDIDGQIEWDRLQPDNEYVEIAFQTSKISMIPPFDIVINHLPDNVKVYPLDNTPQGIYNIGNIKQNLY